jgi:hypothetical protein
MGAQEKGFCLEPDLVSCIFSVLYLLSVVRLVLIVGCICPCLGGNCLLSGVGCLVMTVNCQVSLSVVFVGWCSLSCVGC